MRRWIVRCLYGLAGLLGLAAIGLAGALLWVRGSLPQSEGETIVSGLEGPVEILRDGHGLVTIKAGTEADGHFALGYAHAQDRLFQMEMMRRTGAGRLSEVIGEPTVRFDRYMRTLGFYRLAEANLATLDPEVQAALVSYTAGVNAFLADEDLILPPEFQLLRYRPEPWRPADSLVWGRLMAMQLSSNWHTEIQRLLLAADLTPAQIEFLWPDYPEDGPVTLAALARGVDRAALTRLTEIVPWDWAPKDASNSWVLSGAQTESGAPLLANDPHLSLSAPGTWYLARIETPALTLTGATTPGVPFMVLGHNGRIAWGFTTTHSDTQDIFIERLAEDDPERYQAPDGPLPFETRDETIAIKGGEGQTMTLRRTRHGPVISDLEPEAMGRLEPDQVLALAWTALEADDQTAGALYRINRATDWPGFLDATRRFHSPQQNIVYADLDGTIGFVAPARVPLRKQGDGGAPVPGWTGDHDWAGLIPFEELPQSHDPASGRIISANNKVVPDSYPHLLTADWPDPYRARRITEVLDREPKASLDHSTALQIDSVSLAARELLPALLARLKTDPDSEAPRAALARWDFVMDRDRPEPLLFYGWLRALNRMIFADELGPHFAGFSRPDPALIARVLSEGEDWCDDTATPEDEPCPVIVTRAFSAALMELGRHLDGNWQDWTWGMLHRIQYSHTFWQQIPVIRDWLRADLPVDGGNFTVNRAGARFAGPLERAFESVHGGGYRAVYDLADLDNSRFMIAGGQSGNPLSPHYGDLLPLWRDGLYIELVGPETAEQRRLLLVPRSGPVRE